MKFEKDWNSKSSSHYSSFNTANRQTFHQNFFILVTEYYANRKIKVPNKHIFFTLHIRLSTFRLLLVPSHLNFPLMPTSKIFGTPGISFVTLLGDFFLGISWLFFIARYINLKKHQKSWNIGKKSVNKTHFWAQLL